MLPAPSRRRAAWGARCRRLSVPLAACALAALPVAAAAHEFWLEPAPARGTPATVTVAAAVGTGFRGDAKPYAAPRALRFTLVGPRAVDLRPAAMNGDVAWARITLGDAGGALIAYESDFASLELPAADFDRYLELEGLDGPRAARARLGARAGAGRERYGRCAKTWIAGGDPSRVTRPVGLTLELVPLADPSAPGPLALEVRYRGRPLAGALVRTWRQPADASDFAARDSVGSAAQARSDRAGRVRLPVVEPGRWLASVVHMEPSEDAHAAEWQSRWSSLTFIRKAAR